MVLAMRALALVIVLLVNAAQSYKPVICMHGFSYNSECGTFHDFDNISQWIRAAHPDQIVVQLDINNGVASMEPMWLQLQQITDLIRSIVENNATFSGGYHFLGHSQGALLLRSVIETWDSHLVDNYVSMAGVHMGQFGINGWIEEHFPDTAPSALSDLLYTDFFQSTLSVANWWHDPTKEDDYLEKCVYLPVINDVANVSGSVMEQRKANFLRINSTTLLGSPQGLIDTSQFAFFAPDAQSFVPMQLQNVYLLDTFGLQSLDKQGRLSVKTVSGVPHAEWLANQTNFVQNILQLLT